MIRFAPVNKDVELKTCDEFRASALQLFYLCRDSEEAEDVGVSSSGSRQCTVTLQRAFKAILSNLVSSASELVAQMTEG